MITVDTDYTTIKECEYKGEYYSVRDNGAVLRHPRNDKKPRRMDNQWTFGKKSATNGYMHIGEHRVHIIVATAFYGAHDSTVLVVDHIDTNRCNNRPENLRWITRLENALQNPITRKKIEFLVGGDIHNFINDPSCLRDTTGTNQNLMWMRTVSKEEAKASYDRVMRWAEQKNTTSNTSTGKLGEWIYSIPNNNYVQASTNSTNSNQQDISNIDNFNSMLISDSLTSTALQYEWKTPTEFLCCPAKISESPIENYLNNLSIGQLFSTNKYETTCITEFAISEDKQKIWVLSENRSDNCLKPWKLAEIVFYNNHFLHINRGSYFEEIGGKKYFTLAQGKEWAGENGIDSYC